MYRSEKKKLIAPILLQITYKKDTGTGRLKIISTTICRNYDPWLYTY